MSRFLPWRYIEQRWRPTAAQLLSLADRLMADPAFCDSEGAAIVFGSAAWRDTVTWRSDIDVACNVPKSAHSFKSFWSGEYVDKIVTQECAKVFGVDEAVALEYKSFLVETLGSQAPGKTDHYAFPSISPSTMDHFRLLAGAKGGPWQQFYAAIHPVVECAREHDIVGYADDISWTIQKKLWPAIQDGYRLDSCDLADYQRLENLPKQLTRKLLGIMGALPCPDTWPNLLVRLGEIDEDWSQQLQRLFDPFLAIHDRYTALVDRLFAGTLVMTVYDYNRLILKTLASLPYKELFELTASRFPRGHFVNSFLQQDVIYSCGPRGGGPVQPEELSPNLFEPIFDP